jgi:hypothetical protein
LESFINWKSPRTGFHRNSLSHWITAKIAPLAATLNLSQRRGNPSRFPALSKPEIPDQTGAVEAPKRCHSTTSTTGSTLDMPPPDAVTVKV